MATYGFLSRFMQGRQGPSAQMQGAIDALKGQNGRAGLMDDASALGQVATDAITNPGATTSLNAPAAGGGQPSGNPSGTAAATGDGEGGTTPNGAATTAGGVATTAGGTATTAGMPVAPDAVEATRLSPDIYHWNSDFLTNYLEAPITPEEQEKRTRAAHAVAGIGNLGNVLSAFSNLAFAGQAPSQTLPQVPEAGTAVNKERDRWDRVRREYVNGKLQGRSMDLREYQMAVHQNRMIRQAEFDTRLKEQQLRKAMAEGANAVEIAEYQRRLAEARAREAEAKAGIAEGNLEDQPRKQDEESKNRQATANQRNAAAGLSGKRSETEGQRRKTEEKRTTTEEERAKTERSRQRAQDALADSRRRGGTRSGVGGRLKSSGGKGKGYGNEETGKGRGY